MIDHGLAKTDTAYLDEGVVVTRSADGTTVRLPHLRSAHHQLGVIAILWEVWISAQKEDQDPSREWTVNISDLGEMTLPLIAVMSAIDADLGCAGTRLFVVGSSRTPSLATIGS